MKRTTFVSQTFARQSRWQARLLRSFGIMQKCRLLLFAAVCILSLPAVAQDEEDPVQVGGLRYTIDGDEATCVGGDGNNVLNIPDHITIDGAEYTVTSVKMSGYGSIIVLPKTLKRIVALGVSTKSTIICLAPTPPTIEEISMSRCSLYVPDEYVEAHRKGWFCNGNFAWRYDVETYPNLIPFYIRPMSHLFNYEYDDETMTATVKGFRLQPINSNYVISDALGCTSSRMSNSYSERIWAEQNDINLDWVVPATITRDLYVNGGSMSYVRTGETYAVKKVAKLLGARSVTHSEGIEEIGSSAFALTYHLPVVRVSDGVYQYYNDPLEYVSLPASLKVIEGYAFYGCTSLRKIDFSEGLDSIGTGAFDYCLSLESCELPASPRAMSNGHGNLYSLEGFAVAPGNEHIVVDDGVLYTDGGKTLLQYPAGKPDKSYEVPEGTLKLAPWSFEGMQHLETLVLPASLEEIGSYVFANTYCLKDIHCKAQTPLAATSLLWYAGYQRPEYDLLSAYDGYATVTLHVPAGCKEIYASTAPWSYFLNIVDDVETGIVIPSVSNDRSLTVFNLQGQRVAKPGKGVYIIGGKKVIR